MAPRKLHPTKESFDIVNDFFKNVLPTKIKKDNLAPGSVQTFLFIHNNLEAFRISFSKKFYMKDYGILHTAFIFRVFIGKETVMCYNLTSYRIRPDIEKDAPEYGKMAFPYWNEKLLQGTYTSPVYFTEADKLLNCSWVYHHAGTRIEAVPDNFAFLKPGQRIKEGDRFFNLHTLQFMDVQERDLDLIAGSQIYVVIREITPDNKDATFKPAGIIAHVTVPVE